MRNEVAIARSITVMAVLGVIAALYFAKAVFVPLALAILLTFLLAPAAKLGIAQASRCSPGRGVCVRCHPGPRRAGRPASDEVGAEFTTISIQH